MDTAAKVQIDETVSGQNHEDWRSFTSEKNVSYVVDQQNGNYSNQISWDLTSIVSQSGWMALQEGYVLIPMCTTLTCASAQTQAISSKAVCLKDNFINYMDSMQFFVNGQQLIDQTSYSNFPIQILDKLTMSQDDLTLKGSALNIAPDTPTATRFSATATSGGDGYRNNLQQIPYTTGTGTLTGTPNIIQDPALINQGITKRILNVWDATSTEAPPAINTAVKTAQILSPYFSSDGTTKKVGTWNYVVYLPLKRMSDLLSKYPLVKGSQIRLVINFNAGSVPITIGAATPATYALASTPTMTAGQTQTAMLTDSKLGMGTVASTGIPAIGVASAATLATVVQTQVVSNVANTTAAKGFVQLPNCRVYVPTYKVNPTYEERILSNRVQKIRYIDWYQQPILNIANGSGFSQTLTTALANVQALIMIPFANTSTATTVYAAAGAAGTPQFQSPFDCAPATSLPGGMLAFQNFNVSVSGRNVWNQNQNYVYDNWSQEVQKLGLNSGLSRELSSGLVGLTDWSWSPFVIADLSRREEGADKTYQSVTVMGTNNTGVAVDYYCFIAFQKEIEIDCLTGQVKKIF